MKILVGVGCSHTQGSAFLKNITKSESGEWLELSEWASIAIAEKYKDKPATMDWVTNNLTWMAKLVEKTKHDKIVNLGVGGQGLDVNIINMYSYIDKQKDLSNYTFIHQIPGLTRFNVVYKDYKDRKFKWTSIVNLEGCGAKNLKEFVIMYYSQNFHIFNQMFQLYYLQKYIEKLGGEYYCFSFDMKGDKNTLPKELVDISPYETVRKQMSKDLIYSQGDEQHISLFDNIMNTLNFLTFKITDETLFKGKRLSEEGLLKDDGHFSERGNGVLANYIWEALQQ